MRRSLLIGLRRNVAALASGALLASGLSAHAATPGKLYAVGGFDPDDTGAVPHRIYEINPLTGQATALPGSFGPEPAGLAATADGRILALEIAHSHGAEPGPEQSTLLEIDPYKGFLTKIAVVPIEATGFDVFPDGRAFTIPLPGGAAPVQLHAVNLVTGEATPIGGANAIDDAFAAAFGSAAAANERATQLASVGGQLYAAVRHDANANLVRFDPATGVATVIGAANAVNSANGGAYRGIPGLSGWDSDGDGEFDQLFGVLNYFDHDGDPGTYFQVIGALIKFDLTTGTWSIVGTNPGLLFSGLASTTRLAQGSLPFDTAGLYTRDHGDVRLRYADGSLNLHYNLNYAALVDGQEVGNFEEHQDTGVDFPLAALKTIIPNPPFPRPEGSEWDFIGNAADEPVWFIPEVQEPDRPWLGFSTEDLNPADWVDGQFQFTLIGMSGPPGGHFALYQNDGFDNQVQFATADGIDANDVYRTGGVANPAFPTGVHAHANWTFTLPGRYELSLKFSGVHVTDGLKEVTGTVVVVAGFAAAPEFAFAPFEVPNAGETLLADIRNDGALVGRYKDQANLSHGFTQVDGTLTSFNVTGNTTTFAGGLDDAGRVVGFYRDAVNPDVQHGFRRESNGTITTIDGPGGVETTYLWRLNAAGQMSGYVFDSDPFFIRGFRRESGGTFSERVFPGSPLGTVTRGLNEAGDLVGWKWTDAFALEGVVFWADGATNVFTIPGWANTLPGDINVLGEVAGTVINDDFSVRKGFYRRADGAFTVFAPPGAVETEVFGLNDAGVVVGEYVDAAGRRRGFIARPAIRLERGEVDIGLAYEDGTLEFHAHDETNDVEYSPDMAVLVAGTTAEQPIPDTVAFSFLGEPGRSAWILPQAEEESLLYLGLAAEEIESGLFVNDALRAELVSVEGAGDFFLYTTDAFGAVTVHMNSADGISGADFFPLTAGSHQHVNWAFNAPGSYRIGLRATGTLVAGNQAIASEVFYFNFYAPAAELPQPVEPDDSLAYKFEVIEVAEAEATYAFGINNSKSIVGRFEEAGVGRGYLREPNGTITPTNFPGATFTEAFDINSSGFIVGWYKTSASTNGFLLSASGSFESIAIPQATVTFALGINDDNDITGAYKDAGGVQHGFVRSASGGITSFDPPGATYTEAYGINNAGVVVGYFVDATGERGFVRNASGTIEVFDVPDSHGSGVLGINNTGAWSGFFEDDSGVHGFVRRPNGTMTPLDFPGSSFTVALGLTDDNIVVGYTADALDVIRGFIARPVTRLKTGELDLGFAWEDGELEFHAHDHAADIEYAADAVVLHVPALGQTEVPAAPAFAFLGTAGAPVWILPQSENPKLLFLGLAAEEVEAGVFVNDALELRLQEVDGPGHFSVYSVDGFGQPVIYLNSGDGISVADTHTLDVGAHEHVNWAFTAPGLYRVEFQATGTLVEGGALVESEEFEICFEVIGIEAHLALAVVGDGAAIGFATQDGIVYQLESAPTVNGPWAPLAQPFIGTGRNKSLNVPLDGPAGYFQLRIVKNP